MGYALFFELKFVCQISQEYTEISKLNSGVEYIASFEVTEVIVPLVGMSQGEWAKGTAEEMWTHDGQSSFEILSAFRLQILKCFYYEHDVTKNIAGQDVCCLHWLLVL